MTFTLHDCTTDAERAQWLLSCPLRTLLLDQHEIITELRRRGFPAGVDYVEFELRLMRSPRGPDGDIINKVGAAIARGRIERIAHGLPPRGFNSPEWGML